MSQSILPSFLQRQDGNDGSEAISMVGPSGAAFSDSFDLSRTKLGDGMTATVFVATDRATGQLRACKLAERRGQRPTWNRLCQLLQHESVLLQSIGHHPHIVRWDGCYASPNHICIVMELVAGGDCQQLLQRHGALPEEAVQAMIRQLHSALRCAHQRTESYRT